MEICKEERRWFDDFSNVLLLARWLVEDDQLSDATETIQYFEKPWKWDAEWNEMNHVQMECEDVWKD